MPCWLRVRSTVVGLIRTQEHGTRVNVKRMIAARGNIARGQVSQPLSHSTTSALLLLASPADLVFYINSYYEMSIERVTVSFKIDVPI